MQQIASEFSINWDSKDFEQRMSKSSAFAQVLSATFPSFFTSFIVELNTLPILILLKLLRMSLKLLLFVINYLHRAIILVCLTI